ncbi:hypothetical protein [Mycoplasmopsis columbina]|uniref:hypothetical protein n=1 Tax=Mycoplasmopsis columbina TaxID=114881 RepID=UPI0002D355F1|nr:hypothetical protein [Mycoplasmopsis columbina]
MGIEKFQERILKILNLNSKKFTNKAIKMVPKAIKETIQFSLINEFPMSLVKNI